MEERETINGFIEYLIEKQIIPDDIVLFNYMEDYLEEKLKTKT